MTFDEFWKHYVGGDKDKSLETGRIYAASAWDYQQARIEALEAELAALREAAAKAKWLLDDATYHDGRYGQQSAPDWQKRACKVSDDLAALLQEGSDDL